MTQVEHLSPDNQQGVREVGDEGAVNAKAALRAVEAEIAPNTPESAGTHKFDQSDMRAGINIVLETIALKFDGWDTYDVWRSEAASLVRSFKHTPESAPAETQQGGAK